MKAPDINDADDIELVNATHNGDETDAVTVDRWSNYGKDRVYLNGLDVGDGYISLIDGTVDGDRWTKVTGEWSRDEDLLTVRIGHESEVSEDPAYVITLRATGAAFDEYYGDEDDNDEQDEADGDDSLDARAECGDAATVMTDGGEVAESGDDGDGYHNTAWDYEIEAGDELQITLDYQDGGPTVDGTMTAAEDLTAAEGLAATDSNGRTHTIWFRKGEGVSADNEEGVAYIKTEDGSRVRITRMEVA